MPETGWLLNNVYQTASTQWLAPGGVLRSVNFQADTWGEGDGVFGTQQVAHVMERLHGLDAVLPELDLAMFGVDFETGGPNVDAQFFAFKSVSRVFLRVLRAIPYQGDTRFGEPPGEDLGWFQFFLGPVSGRLRKINFDHQYIESDVGAADGFRLKLSPPALGYVLSAETVRPDQNFKFDPFSGFYYGPG